MTESDLSACKNDTVSGNRDDEKVEFLSVSIGELFCVCRDIQGLTYTKYRRKQ